MTKGQIHFSNLLKALTPVLRENLYPEGADPFAKRLIVVPHLKLKTPLMQELAKSSEWEVAAGLQIVNLHQALAKVCGKKIPSSLELSLFIQHEMPELIESEEELQRYFSKAKETRMGPFASALAKYFLQYLFYGKPLLPSWQEILWQKWNFSLSPAKGKWQIHLFGFSFLPAKIYSLFGQLDAKMYLFSPSEIFLGDFYTKKEKALLQEKMKEPELDLFGGQNPFLSAFAKVGRKMQECVEASQIPTFEHYITPEDETLLATLQRDILAGEEGQWQADPSVSVFSGATLMHEVEEVREKIYALLETVQPKDIQVFAPDITPYVPFIEAAFDEGDFAITDIPRIDLDPICRGFAELISLPKKRFTLDAVLTVLSHQELDLSLITKWLKAAGVKWGFSKEQREAFFLKEVDGKEIHQVEEEGTFACGIRALLHGLGHSEGVQAVSQAEIPEFNRFYVALHSLVEDLEPLYDQTRWTIPTWLRYLACLLETYFSIDPSYDLYKELTELASSTDRLDREKVPFDGVERVLDQLFSKKCKSLQPPHMQAIRFSSLSEGAIEPSSAIFLMGMGEENFPRKEENSSLYVKEKLFRPTSSMQDRYLFLQALLSAKDVFSISYQRKGRLSLALQEVLENIKIEHPKRHLPELSHEEKAPLIPSLYSSKKLVLPTLEPMEIETKKLFKFAKHPLRYHLHEQLGIYPEFGRKAESEFVLDPLSKYLLVRAELKGERQYIPLPSHLLRPLAQEQVEAEVEEWKEAMQTFSIESFETKPIDLQIGPVRVFGSMEFVSEKGVLVRGKNQLEDQVRYLPHALIAKEMGLPLLLTKDGSSFSPSCDFADYLAYFQLAQTVPSPLLPQVVKALLQEKPLKAIEDEVFAFLTLSDPPPNWQVVARNWSEICKDVMGGALAKV